jgi:CheY-like chemotaxis protein/signal transduction histidine kinase/HAMP domain-containing protein
VITTVRAKLFAIFGAALLALLAAFALSAWMGARQNRELDEVQSRLVPRSEAGPRIEAEFERLARAMQDAVAAQDLQALENAQEHKLKIFELLTSAGSAIDPSQAAAVRWNVQAYYETAQVVSRRLIVGESDDQLLQQVSRMQAQQHEAQRLIKSATGVHRDELARAFRTIRNMNSSADRFRLGITATGTFVVALLAFWGARSVLSSLSHLTSGLARFGTGDFSTPIQAQGRDELGAVAEQANLMAASLARLSEARAGDDWLKEGIAGMNERLRGELEPPVLAQKALDYLAERLGALAGALYVRNDDGSMQLLAAHAGGQAASPAELSARFDEGEGLIGQSGTSSDLRFIDDLPADYLKIRSGLGEASPRQLVLVPLVHFERRVGVLELALLTQAPSRARDLLLAVRSLVASALEAARASNARQQLLIETQAQAERLTAQEEELRLNNQELLAQQEELRRANSELERTSHALAEQIEELARARSVLASKAEELNRVSAYKSQFLANMSHELRTPLNSMLLLSDLLAENELGNLNPKQVEHMRTIHAAGKDLLSLINEVLDLSKIEAGKQELVLETVELRHFSGFARRLFEVTATRKGVELETRIAPGMPERIVTDRQRVERILTNLLSNALKFTSHGRVTLEIGRPSSEAALVSGPAVAFSVTDTGIGIPETARERVFAPFEQVQGTANRGYGGTGLGLSIARESARLLGGELTLAESSSAGSRFVCVVPEHSRASSAPVAPRPRVADDAASLKAQDAFLLIVEDDAVQAEQLVDIAHARGLKVVVVSNGDEAVERARHGQVLGIILDVRLPDIDGWSVMERLKQDDQTRSIPVHFVSSVDEPHRGLAMGALGYLVKPASHAELAAMVRKLVPPSASAKNVLVIEDDAQHGSALLAVLEHGGIRGEHVLTAQAALSALATGRFGCLILDLGLPDMDGLRLLQTLRQRPELGSPRVLVHTGRALSKQETRELAAYAEAIVLKDGSSAERLLEEVRLFVRHVTGQRPTPPPPPRSDVSLRGVKLLVAEDDMRTVYSLAALLRSRGAEVLTVETGGEALSALEAHRDVRAVLMDVMMPEMDGYEAMRRLRLDARLATLPVIALTAKAMKGERERCLEAGASDYLPKPVDGDKLLAKLQTWLSSGGHDAAQQPGG